MAYAVAENLGYAKDKVTWARVPFNAAIQPGPKTYDINLTEFSITEERRAAVDFSSPYYDVKQAVVTIGTSPAANAASLAELKNAKLGAQVGTTSYQAIVDQIAPAAPPAVFNTNDDAKLALTNGQVDAIVVDLPTAFYITGAELDGGKIIGQLPLAGRHPRAVRHRAGQGQRADRLRVPGGGHAARRRHPDRAGDPVARLRRHRARAAVTVRHRDVPTRLMPIVGRAGGTAPGGRPVERVHRRGQPARPGSAGDQAGGLPRAAPAGHRAPDQRAGRADGRGGRAARRAGAGRAGHAGR